MKYRAAPTYDDTGKRHVSVDAIDWLSVVLECIDKSDLHLKRKGSCRSVATRYAAYALPAHLDKNVDVTYISRNTLISSPTQEKLTEETGLGKNTVPEAIKTLVALNALSKTQNSKKGKHGTVYILKNPMQIKPQALSKDTEKLKPQQAIKDSVKEKHSLRAALNAVVGGKMEQRTGCQNSAKAGEYDPEEPF